MPESERTITLWPMTSERREELRVLADETLGEEHIHTLQAALHEALDQIERQRRFNEMDYQARQFPEYP